MERNYAASPVPPKTRYGYGAVGIKWFGHFSGLIDQVRQLPVIRSGVEGEERGMQRFCVTIANEEMTFRRARRY